MMLTRSQTNDALAPPANLDLDNYIKKKNRHRKIKKIDTFLIDNVRCAIGVSGRFFSTCRLYCVYPLLVENGSLFYRALVDDNPKEYFKYTVKETTRQGIYYETVERLKKYHFKGSKTALDHLEKLKRDCKDGKCIVTGKHYYMFSNLGLYCKAESGNNVGEKTSILKQLTAIVEVNPLEQGDYQKVREGVMKGFGKCLKGEVYCMTACLDITPFKFRGTDVKCFFVDCTRFYLGWKIWMEDHYVWHNSDAIKNFLFLFITTPDGKLRALSELTYLMIPNLSLNYFAGTSWDDLPYNSKVLFKTITNQSLMKESHAKTLTDKVAPGSILRLDEENMAVCLDNGEILQIGPHRQCESESPSSAKSAKEKMDAFFTHHKEYKKVQVAMNPFQIKDLDAQLVEVSPSPSPSPARTSESKSTRMSRENSGNSSSEGSETYPVIGVIITLKPGALKRMVSKPSVMNMQL